jgi:hypothetical protein
MRCDHLDAIAFGQISIQAVIVIGFAGDQSRREVIEEAVSEDAFDEFAFVTGFRVYSLRPEPIGTAPAVGNRLNWCKIALRTVTDGLSCIRLLGMHHLAQIVK